MMTRTTARTFRCAAIFLTILAVLSSGAEAGFRRGFGPQVGGVSIDAEGVVSQATAESGKMLLADLREQIRAASPELALPTELRMISLKGLHEVIASARRDNVVQLPDEIRFLAGLQRLQYVFVFPEENDIVLAGPGEGWKIRDDASVVGITTDRPVLLLEDLLVALRQVEAARRVGISVSIDPTPEGTKNLNDFLENQRRLGRSPNPATWEPAMKQAFGPQQIRFTGVPETSHFARVLLAADYRMKRLGMKLDPSPVKGLPSYLDLLNKTRLTATNSPRWWLACNYEPVQRSEDGLAWELRGQGVKALTEDGFLNPEGEIVDAGRARGPAQLWADAMTTHYEELSQVDSVFGQLRNLMDMCVVAALIEHHGLMAKAGCSLPLLTDSGRELTLEEWHAPKTVAPHCSFLKVRNSWIVTASGGVQIESWQVASNVETDPAVQETRDRAVRAGRDGWWW